MFSLLASVFGLSKKEAKILVIGLDNSGKTTLINHLKPKKSSTFEVTPTVGFQVEELKKNNINFTMFDMSGQGKYRTLWEHYYADAQAIIFVLDSTDRLRMCVAKEELQTLLQHADIASSNIPVVFFANKMDIPGAMTEEECAEELELTDIRDKPWHIVSSNALNGAGIEDGVEWLCDHVNTKASRK